MVSRRTRAAALIVVGGLMAGCQHNRQQQQQQEQSSQPSASTLSPMDQQAAAQLQRTYRNSHPGSEVGVVNAALPDRHIISVTGIPLDRIQIGDVVNVMAGGANGGLVPAVVYSKSSGYVQLRYQPLSAGQTDPAAGNLAVWTPGGAVVPPEAIAPRGDVTVPPAAPPPTTMPESPSPAPLSRTRSRDLGAPAATMPLMDAQPATQPTVPQDAPPPPPPVASPPSTTETPATSRPTTLPLMPLDSPPLVVPDTRPAVRPDLNK